MCYNCCIMLGQVCALVYAIIALVVLAAASAWLCWHCYTLRKALTKARSRCQELQKDRAIRQNLQQVLERRESEIRRLRGVIAGYEQDIREMESRASDLNMSLFQESGLRILAEKEDGAKRLKMDQLEQQLEALRKKLREQADRAAEREEQLRAELAAHDAAAAEREEQLRQQITAQEEEINRLRTINARRLARKTQVEGVKIGQVTMDDVLAGK